MPDNSVLSSQKATWEIDLPSSKWLYLLLVSFFLLSSLVFLRTRFPIFMDEAIFSDMVSRFNQGLGLSTPLFEYYMPFVETHAYWYPPVYFLALSPLYFLFADPLLVSRMFSLVSSMAVIGLFYLVSKKLFSFRYSGLAALLLLVTDTYFQEAAVVGRMEMYTIWWGMLAWYSHWRFLESRAVPKRATAGPEQAIPDLQQAAAVLQRPTASHLKFNHWNVMSGVSSALSLLTHPTGAILVLPIGLNLIFAFSLFPRQKYSLFAKKANSDNKNSDNINSVINNSTIRNWQVWLEFGLPMALGIVLWTASFWTNWDIFVLQNKLQMFRKEFGIYYVLETIRYKPWHRWVMLIYLLSNTFYVLRGLLEQQYRQPQTRLLMFLAATSAMLTILLKEMWYVVYLPLIGTLILVKNLEGLWQKRPALPGLILGVLVFFNLIIYVEVVEKINSVSEDYEQFASGVGSSLPTGASVLLSSMPDPYFYLSEHRPDLRLRQSPNSQPGEPIDVEVYHRVLGEVDYVVITFFINQHIAEYVQENLDEVVYEVAESGRYPVRVVRLKPPSDRKELLVPEHLRWQYPVGDTQGFR
jgi:hypothetical protein